MQSSITRVMLSNGLLVLLKEIHTAPIVSHWIWYRVGARDEIAGMTGASFLVQNMLFRGTSKFPAGEYANKLSELGASWNAFTYLDWTAYFVTLPSSYVDLAIALEADRMVNGGFEAKDLELERSITIASRHEQETNQLFLIGEQVQAVAFRIHSYRHEVLGDLFDLENIRLSDIYNHYQRFYVPNNAVLALAGDFRTDVMLSKIQKVFEQIPVSEQPSRLIRPEPFSNGEVRTVFEGLGNSSYLQVAYHAPAATNSDFFPLYILDSLLTGPSNLNMFSGGISNRTSRLYRALVDKELALSVHGGLQATIDPFLYTITIMIHPKHKTEEVLDALDKEIQSVHEKRVSKEEINRAIKQARALFAYGSENITNQAFWLGYSEMFDTYEWFTSFLDTLTSIDSEELQRVAKSYLTNRNRVIGIYAAVGN